MARFAFAAVLITAVLLLCGSTWLAYSRISGTAAGNVQVDDALAARFAAESLMSTLKDAETGERGFLLTGDPAYLKPYDAALARLEADFVRLEQAPLMEHERRGRIARMRALAASKLSILGRLVALRRSGQTDSSLALMRTEAGQHVMDALRAEFNAMQRDITSSLREARGRGVGSLVSWTEPGVLAGLGFLLLGGIVYTQGRATRSIASSYGQLGRFTRGFNLVQGMVRDLDGRITFWNEGSERLYGYSSGEAVGQISHVLLQARFPEALAAIEETLLRDGQWQGEVVHRRRDGTEIAVASHWVLHPGSHGEPASVIEVNNDVTALQQAEIAYRENEAVLRLMVNTAPGLIYSKDCEGRFVLASGAVLSLLGRSWAEVEGRTDFDLLDDPAQAETVMANDRRVMRSGRAEEMEELVGSVRGRPRVWLSTKTPFRDPNGIVAGLVGLSVEITERKQAEERLRLLVYELNHRVKNTLATVQAIAAHSLRGADVDIRDKLEGRLKALSTAHDVLTRESWDGADIEDIVAGALAAYRGVSSDRFVVSGPRLRLRPRAALAIAMGLHELATNALKYGALLSTAEAGRIDVHWTVDHGRWHFEWSERGGPAVIPPRARGFGSRLIERSLAQDLHGVSTICFEPQGLVCVIDAPLTEIAAAAGFHAFPGVGSNGGLVR